MNKQLNTTKLRTENGQRVNKRDLKNYNLISEYINEYTYTKNGINYNIKTTTKILKPKFKQLTLNL